MIFFYNICLLSVVKTHLNLQLHDKVEAIGHNDAKFPLYAWHIVAFVVETLRLSESRYAMQRLRSVLVNVPSTRRSVLCDRAFPEAAARAWNAPYTSLNQRAPAVSVTAFR